MITIENDEVKMVGSTDQLKQEFELIAKHMANLIDAMEVTRIAYRAAVKKIIEGECESMMKLEKGDRFYLPCTVTGKDAHLITLKADCNEQKLIVGWTEDVEKAAVPIGDKYRWHDLRKNPEDLPEGEKRLLDIVPMQPDSFERYYGWFDGENFIDQNGFSFNAIAWREIEPFEEGE